MLNPKPRTSLAVIVLSAVAGILSRRFGAYLPIFIASYGGDTLWALAAFASIRLVFPKLRLSHVFLLALDLSCLIELSQLYQAEWINRLRHLPGMGFILGYGFRWTDLLCYLSGCLMGWGLFYFLEKGKTIK